MSASPKDAAFEAVGGFSDLERTVLSGGSSGAGGLRNREYLIAAGSAEEHSLLLGLADVLFAFCHECRLTGGEPNVESASNISRLSCCLGWLDSFSEERGDDVATVITHCARRSLIYPYLRHWKLTRKVLTDVCKVLVLGRRCVLKCLLQLRGIFERTDSHYMLNKLFLDDYCVWVQQVGEDTLQRFAKRYNDAKNAFEGGGDKGKGRVELNLTALEEWAEGRVRMEGDDEDEDEEEEDEDEEDEEGDEEEEDVDEESSRTAQAAGVVNDGNGDAVVSVGEGQGDSDIDSDEDREGVPRRLRPRPPPHLIASPSPSTPAPALFLQSAFAHELGTPRDCRGAATAGTSQPLPQPLTETETEPHTQSHTQPLLISGSKRTASDEQQAQGPKPPQPPLIVELSSWTCADGDRDS